MFETIISSLQLTGLFPIVGGTVVIGALIAPLTFKSLNKKEASKLMVQMFKKFDDWIKVAATILLASKLIEVIFIDKFSFSKTLVVDGNQVSKLDTGSLLTLILVLAIAAISYHIVFKLTPQIDSTYKANKDSQGKKFQDLHKQSEMLHKVNFLLGFILLLSFAA